MNPTNLTFRWTLGFVVASCFVTTSLLMAIPDSGWSADEPTVAQLAIALALESNELEARRNAAVVALMKLGNAATHAVPTLVSMLGSEDPSKRASPAYGSGPLEPVRKGGQAPYILCQHEYPITTSGSQSPFSDRLLGPWARSAVPALIEAMTDAPDLANGLTEELSKALADSDSSVRARAAAMIATIGAINGTSVAEE